MNKVEFPIDKRRWHPSLIPGPVTLISTYDGRKEPNIAPKSWLQMISFEPPMLMFSGQQSNTTEVNIAESNCFGINFIDSSLASKTWECIKWTGRERIDRSGFTLVEAKEIEAPLVAECRAHLECRLHSTREIGHALIVFGEIVAASIWEDILRAEGTDRYALLDQVLYLEEGVASRIGEIYKVK
ncbi:flavin reductase family protein [Candidatus Zixiibacteriota bacterium]